MMEAARFIDMLGCQPGWTVEQADAEQAYVQSYLRGTETWVEIPEEAWPDEWYEKGFKDFKDLDWENEVDRFHLNNDDLQQDLISTAKAQFA